MEGKMQSQFTQAEKEAIVKEVKEVGNRNLVARKHGLSESTIRNWERKEQKKKEPKTEEDMFKELKILREKIRKQELEIMILKDLAKKL